MRTEPDNWSPQLVGVLKRTPKLGRFVRRVGGSLLLSGGATMFCLLLVELSLRWGWVGGYAFLPDVKNRPNHRYSFAKPPGVFRILVLGDSFCTGERGFPVLLEESLNRQSAGARFEVVNMGAPGIGPDKYLQYFQLHGYRYHPDLVLVSVYLGNDVRDIVYSAVHPSRARRMKNYLASRSYLYQLIYDRYIAYQYAPHRVKKENGKWRMENGERRGLSEVPKELVRAVEEGKVNCFLIERAVANPRWVKENLDISTPELKAGWEKLESVMKEIKQLAAQLGAKIVVVAIPDCVQVHARYLPFYQAVGFEIDADALKADKPQRRIRRIGEQLDVPVLDLLPVFKSHPERRLYLSQDLHWTAEGHQLAAQSIVQFLQQEGVVPVAHHHAQ